MRILIVNKFARIRGGADRHCLDLLDALRGAGHEVALLSTASAGNRALPGAFVPATVTAEDRQCLGPGQAQRAARRCLWNTTAAAATERLLDEFSPHVVHLHKLYPQLSAAPAALAAHRRIPVVQTLHDYELLTGMALDDGRLSPPPESVSAADRLLAPPLRLVGRWLHRPAVSAWVVGSEYVRRAYAGAGIEANVLPLPVAVAQLPHVPFAQRHGAVFVGRLTHDKGALDLVKLAHSPAPLEIHAVGTGPLEGQLREQARDLPNLHVHGNLGPDEVWRRLSAARMLVVPSRWAEPVGLGALEAMAMGTPVIAYRVGGLAEAVGGAGAGVLTGPDAGELAAACRALDTDEPLWLQLSAAGRAHVAEHHRPEDYVARLMSVYAAAGAGPV